MKTLLVGDFLSRNQVPQRQQGIDCWKLEALTPSQCGGSNSRTRQRPTGSSSDAAYRCRAQMQQEQVFKCSLYMHMQIYLTLEVRQTVVHCPCKMCGTTKK
eukprot:1147666-Pelagomonas_calceolata.AAC.8